VLLDATWQESQKMLNQSPYLQQAQRFSLSPGGPSAFSRRRNQRSGALCTAEVVIELLSQAGLQHQADALHLAFERFNQRIE